MLQLTGNLCVPHKAFHKLQLIVLVGLDFCNAHAGVRRRRRCDFSETPPPIHLAMADKPDKVISASALDAFTPPARGCSGETQTPQSAPSHWTFGRGPGLCDSHKVKVIRTVFCQRFFLYFLSFFVSLRLSRKLASCEGETASSFQIIFSFFNYYFLSLVIVIN